MKRSTVVILKTAVWIACLGPIGLLVRGAIVPGGLGPDPTAHIALTTGYTTLMLLTVTLAITPVRKFVPQLNWAIRFRRLLGLFAFFYGTVHMLTWVALYNYFSLHAMVHDIAKRRFITMGVAAYLLLLPLAVTSTNWAIRKMGGKRWNRLHKLVYVAAICGIIHYWWQVKTGVLLPLPFSIAIGILLGLRPVIAWRQRRKSRPTVAA